MKNGKEVSIAKRIVLAKIEGQNQVLRKYGFRQHDMIRIKERVKGVESGDLKVARNKLPTIEGHATEKYFGQVLRAL